MVSLVVFELPAVAVELEPIVCDVPLVATCSVVGNGRTDVATTFASAEVAATIVEVRVEAPVITDEIAVVEDASLVTIVGLVSDVVSGMVMMFDAEPAVDMKAVLVGDVSPFVDVSVDDTWAVETVVL